ncbi:MAG: hypothetical protein P8107_08895 [Spirochaetia bacterium]
MQKIIITTTILLLFAVSANAETLRVGVTAAAELAGELDSEDFFDNITDTPVVFPGLYWEVILGHIGFGMTYLGRFEKTDTGHPPTWAIDWIGSFDFRYHFITEFLFDPFVEFGIGCAGRALINNYNADNVYGPLNLSMFFQAGGGVALRLDSFHVGIKLVYRVLNEPIPATDFDVYPLYKLQGSLFAGLSF